MMLGGRVWLVGTVTICLDSQDAIKLIRDNRMKSRLVRVCQEHLILLQFMVPWIRVVFRTVLLQKISKAVSWRRLNLSGLGLSFFLWETNSTPTFWRVILMPLFSGKKTFLDNPITCLRMVTGYRAGVWSKSSLLGPAVERGRECAIPLVKKWR